MVDMPKAVGCLLSVAIKKNIEERKETLNSFTDYSEKALYVLIKFALKNVIGPSKFSGESYHIDIRLPSTDKLHDVTIRCDWRLQQILRPYQSIIKQRCSQCDDLVALLKDIESIVEKQTLQTQTKSVGFSRLCRQLMSDIEKLGWDKLHQIDSSFTEIQLKYVDVGQRCHIIKLHIGSSYPTESPRCMVELPVKFDFHWSHESDLSHIYNQFTDLVQRFQDFFDMVGEIDQNTWVLEPEKPTYSATYRRIAISPSVSVQISVDPTQPRLLPDCKFLGSDHAIAPIRHRLNTNAHVWDERKSLLDNLSSLLKVEFPSPVNSTKEQFNLECGICYSYRLETEIPNEVCNDKRCGQAYHTTCLLEWLRSIPTCRQSFHTIFGNCPYCERSITVRFTSN